MTSNLSRMAFTAVSILCLGASVMAGPGPMFMMIDGKMMEVIPMKKDMTLKNGCKVCMNGAVTDAAGKTTGSKMATWFPPRDPGCPPTTPTAASRIPAIH